MKINFLLSLQLINGNWGSAVSGFPRYREGGGEMSLSYVPSLRPNVEAGETLICPALVGRTGQSERTLGQGPRKCTNEPKPSAPSFERHKPDGWPTNQIQICRTKPFPKSDTPVAWVTLRPRTDHRPFPDTCGKRRQCPHSRHYIIDRLSSIPYFTALIFT